MNLNSMPHFFLDLQTTGSKPENSNILEMAFCSKHQGMHSFLIEQPEKAEIPRRIQMITGVKNKDMEDAISFPEAMERLVHFTETVSDKKDTICIIHFAQFEKPFLNAAFTAIEKKMPFSIICTHDIAKRLLPNLPTRGIKGLGGYFGFDAGELKRSAGHVEATTIIWEKLTQRLEEIGITTLDELSQWLIETPKATRSKYEYPLAKEKRLNLPDVPGIYRMLNFDGVVLYVGKATSLKRRVNSYFRGQKKRDPRKLEMLTQVMDLHVTPCATPLEAALMETDEIKRLNPRYNISLKVGRRSLVFFDRNFLSMSSTPDEMHTIGPYSNSLVFESMMSLSASLKNNLLPDVNTFFEPMDPVFLKEGFDLFCERHSFKNDFFFSMRAVVAIGIIWQRRHKYLADDPILEIEENLDASPEEIEEEIAEELNAEVEEVLTPDDLADKFERHFTRIGQAYLRARKINRMLNSDVEFHTSEKSSRKIFVRAGKIIYEVTFLPYKNLETWSDHSIETYDRMTVLLTELERVRTNDGSYRIIFL